jgi:hypothetical protein
MKVTELNKIRLVANTFSTDVAIGNKLTYSGPAIIPFPSKYGYNELCHLMDGIACVQKKS